MRSVAELDRIDDTRQPPDDGAWVVEQAQDEWERGYLSGEFDEAMDAEHPLMQELHGRIDAKHETERERWTALRGFLRRHFPHTYYAAMDRVIEQRIEALLNE